MEEEFKRLERTVRNELNLVDNYRHFLNGISIGQLREYFNNIRDLQVQIESLEVVDLSLLSKKYTAVFSKKKPKEEN